MVIQPKHIWIKILFAEKRKTLDKILFQPLSEIVEDFKHIVEARAASKIKPERNWNFVLTENTWEQLAGCRGDFNVMVQINHIVNIKKVTSLKKQLGYVSN